MLVSAGQSWVPGSETTLCVGLTIWGGLEEEGHRDLVQDVSWTSRVTAMEYICRGIPLPGTSAAQMEKR